MIKDSFNKTLKKIVSHLFRQTEITKKIANTALHCLQRFHFENSEILNFTINRFYTFTRWLIYLDIVKEPILN